MNKKENSSDILRNIRVASPCNVGFENMEGTDQVRFCGSCKMNVYNIGGMSSAEAQKLIQETEGRLCVRLYQRKDGTVITDNCPIGFRRIRNRLVKVGVFALFFAGLGWLSGEQAHSQGLVGAPVDGPRYYGPVEELATSAKDNSATLLCAVLVVLKSLVWLVKKTTCSFQTWLFLAYFVPFACGTLVHFVYLGVTDDIVITILDGLARSFTTGMTFGIVCLFFAWLRFGGELKPLSR